MIAWLTFSMQHTIWCLLKIFSGTSEGAARQYGRKGKIMMNYEEFKQAVEANILNYLPQEYQGYEAHVEPVYKNNAKYDGLTLVKKSGKTNVSPTVYLQNAYEGYKVEALESIMQNLADVLVRGFKERPVQSMEELSFSNDQIIFQLINREQNKERLQGIPHRDFLDLAIVYRYIIDIQENSTATILVTNELAKRNNLTEEELYELAMVNTKRIMPVFIQGMGKTLTELGFEDPELLDVLDNDCPMNIISNEIKSYGATSILYEEYLYELASKLESDLYILPSSIHECILLSTNEGQEIEMLSEMVCSINATEVSIEERLSNQVYRYMRETRTITIVTNNSASLVDYDVA